MITMMLYSRPECHLCERMAEELAPLLQGRARLEVVDVSDDPELERRYGRRIPVLVAGGTELSVYHLDRGRLERFFARCD